MENQEIITQLKKFSAVKPDEGYSKGSLALIVSSPKKTGLFFGFLKSTLAGVAVFSLVAVVGVYLVGIWGEGEQTPYVSLNSEDIASELADLNINIELEEVEYRQSVHHAIASALDEISSDEVSHLNRSLLEAEQDLFGDIDSSLEDEIDDLLKSVIF